MLGLHDHHSSLKKLLLYFMHICLCVYAHMHEGAQKGRKRASYPHDLVAAGYSLPYVGTLQEQQAILVLSSLSRSTALRFSCIVGFLYHPDSSSCPES